MTVPTSPDPLTVCEAAARAGGRILLDWVGRVAARRKGPRDLVTEADFASQREIRRIVGEAFPEHGFVGEEADAGSPPPPAGSPGHSGTGTRWIVDPLDGTTNYVHGLPMWCVSIALARGDELLAATIFDPLRDECFTARAGGGAWLDGRPIRVAAVTEAVEAVAAVSFPPHVSSDDPAVADFLAVLPAVHSVRRTGSTALNLAWLACGRLHALWARRIACWDAAAGLLILGEAGGNAGRFADGGSPVPLDDAAFVACCTPRLSETVRRLLGV
ncbi:MAG: inositol monophosphatase [Planctomycetes bacterium]|nr:inositol monophosphatase [Planctomycetota bacterium]